MTKNSHRPYRTETNNFEIENSQGYPETEFGYICNIDRKQILKNMWFQISCYVHQIDYIQTVDQKLYFQLKKQRKHKIMYVSQQILFLHIALNIR